MYKMDGLTMREKGRVFRQKSVGDALSPSHTASAASAAIAAMANNGGGGNSNTGGSGSAGSGSSGGAQAAVGSTMRSFHVSGNSTKIVQSDMEVFQMIMLDALKAMEALVTRANNFLAHTSGPDESERAKKQLEDLFEVLIALAGLQQSERMCQLLLTSLKLFLFRFSSLIFRSSEVRWTKFW